MNKTLFSTQNRTENRISAVVNIDYAFVDLCHFIKDKK